MALREKAAFIFIVRLFLTLAILIAIIGFAGLGGFLNRCRGGFINFGEFLEYWPAHILSRQIFSFSTGLLVLILSFHWRAGLVVWLLTQWSLFVGWGTYMNIGSAPGNYESREGIFDWMLQRQEEDWNYTQRFAREYTGMSLRGLVWTAPQGYALQQLGFGWQYSLTGSLMGAVYFAGSKSHFNISGNFLNGTISFSEFYWGTWVWFVLIISCLTRVVYSTRKWVYSRSTSVRNPYLRWERLKYESLNYSISQILYNLFMVALWLVFAATCVFYSLIVQTDIRNKGQTFFGLFMSFVSLTFFIGFVWGMAYTRWIFKKSRHDQVEHISRKPHPSRMNDIDRLEGGEHLYVPGETDPLLPWPYSHPDKVFAERRRSPTDGSRSSTPLSYSPSLVHLRGTQHNPNKSFSARQQSLPVRQQLSSSAYAFILIWPTIEKWICLDIFPWIRHLIGLLSIFSTIMMIVLCCIVIVVDINAPTFDPQYYVCVNNSVWNNTYT